MIGEVLAGAALIKSSVSAIKGAIGTAKDVNEIASFIDQMFLGKAQLEKQQLSANSLNSVAKDMINDELAKEAEQQVKLMVNMRFGSRTWDRIVAERSRRVKAAEKRLKAQKIRRQEQIETAIAIGFLLSCVAVIGGLLSWYFLK
jgi:hypothetical protein